MANALIYTQSGGGKTCNSTLVAAPKRKKNLLICSDNSSIVLNNFERPNLTIKNVGTVKDFIGEYQAGYTSKKYEKLYVAGFRYFMGLCYNKNPWMSITDNTIRMGRLMVTGGNLKDKPAMFEDLFDTTKVYGAK